MIFCLKHFDTPLLTFTYNNVTKEQVCNIVSINTDYKHLLPIGLTLTDSGIFTWLQNRTLPECRGHADALRAKMGQTHADTVEIIRLCKGLSLKDCYWIVEENFTGLFADYNLYENAFENALSLVAHTGFGNVKSNLRFFSSPEYTTNGMIRKAWRRINGKTVLYKSRTPGPSKTGNEPYSEFYAAQIANTMGLPHVFYDIAKWKGRPCSVCELFTSMKYSYVHIKDFVHDARIFDVAEFMKTLGMDFYTDFVDMLVFDAIICNEDRHYGNFGLLVDNEMNKPVSLAPIFDNGLSLFNKATAEDLKSIEKYATTLQSSYKIPFLELVQNYITDSQKEKINMLKGFKFTLHKSYNLPVHRLKIIESFIQKRIVELLNLQ